MANKIETHLVQHPINIGIEEKMRKQVCQGLAKLLADSYLLYLKTQNYHWNVTGKMFRPLHSLFEEQYLDLAEAIDTIAERMRALGEYAPGSLTAFSKLTSIKEENSVPNADEMIHNLIVGNEALLVTARTNIRLCDEAEDDVSLGIIVSRMERHEKNAWMLRSMAPEARSH